MGLPTPAWKRSTPRSSGSRKRPGASGMWNISRPRSISIVEDWISIRPTRKPEEPKMKTGRERLVPARSPFVGSSDLLHFAQVLDGVLGRFGRHVGVAGLAVLDGVLQGLDRPVQVGVLHVLLGALGMHQG